MAFHQYNKFQYNTAQYNADTHFYVQALTESIASADSKVPEAFKALAEALASSDAAVKYLATSKADFVFLLDLLSKSVTNKGFSESIRTGDWLQISRKNSSWSN